MHQTMEDPVVVLYTQIIPLKALQLPEMSSNPGLDLYFTNMSVLPEFIV